MTNEKLFCTCFGCLLTDTSLHTFCTYGICMCGPTSDFGRRRLLILRPPEALYLNVETVNKTRFKPVFGSPASVYE